LPGASAEPDGLTGPLEVSSDSRIRFRWLEERASCIAEPAGGARRARQGQGVGGMGIVKPDALALLWLKVAESDVAPGDAIGWGTLEAGSGPEQLALCFIGLLAMVPSALRRRGAIGGRRTRRCRGAHTKRYRTS
jgi:hypothetical protein